MIWLAHRSLVDLGWFTSFQASYTNIPVRGFKIKWRHCDCIWKNLGGKDIELANWPDCNACASCDIVCLSLVHTPLHISMSVSRLVQGFTETPASDRKLSNFGGTKFAYRWYDSLWSSEVASFSSFLMNFDSRYQNPTCDWTHSCQWLMMATW